MAIADRKMTTRVALNRQAFAKIDLAIADGLLATAERVVERARVPDAEPYGKGLVEGGAAIAYVGKKKVGGTTIGNRQVQKPRSVRLSGTEIVAIGGYGFPARFLELGTIHVHARPFLTPALLSEQPEAGANIRSALARRLGTGATR